MLIMNVGTITLQNQVYDIGAYWEGFGDRLLPGCVAKRKPPTFSETPFLHL